ncbi:hypothetical protein D3C81_866040 [compost metagenome]
MQVFVEVDEILALGVGEDRPGEVDLGFGTEHWLRRRFQAQRCQRIGSPASGVGQHIAQCVTAVHRAGDIQPGRQVADDEFVAVHIVGQLAASLAQQLVHRHVARRHAQQVAGQAQAMRADLALAGDRANIHATHVAHARFVQGFVHGAAQVHGYIAALQFCGQCGIGWRGAHVDHRGHGHALLLQVEGGEVAVIVAGEDYRALARLDRVQLHQPLRGAGQHDPRQVVVAEHHRLVERTGRHQAAAGAHLVQAFVLDHRQVVVGEPAVAGGFQQHLDVRVAFDGSQQFLAQAGGAGAGNVEAGVGERAAKHRLLLDQQHLGPGIGRVQCRTQARRASADDGQIDEQIGLVVVLRPETEVEHAQAGLLADQRLPHLPHALGLVERAVIEADRHEARKLAQVGVAVVRQATVEVLPFDHLAIAGGLQVGQHIGLVRQLHQGVGILPGHAQRAARAVVLERARQQPAAAAEQGAGDAVTGKALAGLAVELEVQRPLAVDQQAHGRGEASVAVHPAISGVAAGVKSTRRSNSSFGSKVRSTWSLTVWRSARNQ